MTTFCRSIVETFNPSLIREASGYFVLSFSLGARIRHAVVSYDNGSVRFHGINSALEDWNLYHGAAYHGKPMEEETAIRYSNRYILTRWRLAIHDPRRIGPLTLPPT